MESELEKEIAECAKSGRLEPDADEASVVSRKAIGRLNERTGKNFKPECESTLYLIGNKLKEGYTEEQLLAVVDEMCYRWGGDSERQIYLRPLTLFGDKFESYLQEAMQRTVSPFEHNDIARMAIERIQGGN